MNIEYSPRFNKTYKKLHKSHQKQIQNIIEVIKEKPTIGDEKVGDLSGFRVHKGRLDNQQILIIYTYCDDSNVLRFIDFGSHENFYRDVKKHIK